MFLCWRRQNLVADFSTSTNRLLLSNIRALEFSGGRQLDPFSPETQY